MKRMVMMPLVVAMVLACSSSTSAAPEYKQQPAVKIQPRSGIGNVIRKIKAKEEVTVAYLGGSITAAAGWRPKTTAWLKAKYPEAQFKEIHAAIGGTGSDLGVFRVGRDVLQHDPDLLFVEFAVNDNQDAANTRQECVMGMEGIARHTLLENPLADVVFLYSANESHIAAYQSGQTPVEIAAHEAVAEAYSLCSVNFAADIAARLAAGEFDWEKFGGVHPADFGAELYAQSVRGLLESCRTDFKGRRPAAHRLPAVMDEDSYFGGCLVGVDKVKADSGWEIGIPDWQSIPGATRERFNNIDMLHAAKPGAAFELDFTGTAVGLFVVAGQDAGIVEYNIDGGASKTADLFHRYSGLLHYPRSLILEGRLPAGKHKLRLRISDKKNPQSGGTAVRIIAVLNNF